MYSGTLTVYTQYTSNCPGCFVNTGSHCPRSDYISSQFRVVSSSGQQILYSGYNKISVSVISNSSRTQSQNIVIRISIILGVLLIHVTLAVTFACTTPYSLSLSLVVREHYYPYGPGFIIRYHDTLMTHSNPTSNSILSV